MRNLPDMVDFIKERLQGLKLKKNQAIKTVLLSEDMLSQLIEHRQNDGARLSITISHSFGRGSLVLKCPGSAFRLEDTDMGLSDLLNRDSKDDDEDALV